MRALEFLIEKASNSQPVVPGDPNSDPLYGLKAAIAHKIKDLPNTPEVKNELKEIEDTLSHLNAGKKRRGSAEDELGTWQDTDVQEAKTMLARYIVSMNAPVEARQKMLEVWKKEGLINLDKLLSSGKNTVENIVKGYSKNPAVKEMADDLVMVDSMGVGKGEFMLRVLSPIITKAKGSGDVAIKGKGTLEIKTNNVNAARFTDQNVKPASGYEKAAGDFRKKYGQYNAQHLAQQPAPAPKGKKKVAPAPANQAPEQQVQQPILQQQPQQQLAPQGAMQNIKPGLSEAKLDDGYSKSGINIDQLIALYGVVPQEAKAEFVTDLTNVLSLVAPKKTDYAKPIADAIVQGNTGKAKQLYSQACLFNYMEQKHDIGILFIDVAKPPITFTFFNDFKSLVSSGLRLDSSTAYPVSSDARLVYPPTKVVATTKEQPTI